MGGVAERKSSRNSPGGNQAGGFSASKVLEMANNFQSYTASTSSVTEDDGIKEAQRALAELILSEEHNHVQNILLEGLARAGDSAIREAYFQFKQSSPGKMAKMALEAPQNAIESILGTESKGMARAMANVVTLPYGVAKAADTLLEKDITDQSTVDSFNALTNSAVEAGTITNIDSGDSGKGLPVAQSSSLDDVTKVVADQLRDPDSVLRSSASPAVIANLARRFGGSLLLRAADRLEETHQELVKTGRVRRHTTSFPLEADELSAVAAITASSTARNLVEQIAPEVVPIEID